jgi:Kdo2-lipid IVA lauroyltransferase/acyltransferase
MARRRKRLRGPRSVLVAAFVRALSLAFGSLSWRLAQRLGAQVGHLAWVLSRRDRRRVLDHLQIAFPELLSHERRRLARAVYTHLGTTLGEVLHLLRRERAEILRHVEIEGWEEIERARAAGQPILLVSAHCGNWELVHAAVNCRGLGMSVVVRQLDEAPLDRLLSGMRSHFGTATIARGGPGAARALLTATRGGRALGLMIDQDTKVEGVWVPFFDRLAFTPVGAAELARRMKAAVIPVFIERRADGSHLLRLQPAVELDSDVTAATAQLTQSIEEQIRRVPEQWVWFHRRWRRRPAAESA